ncbi:MAG: hypothetical protein AB7P20_03100 [Rhizobiaceae bacterium]
MTIEYGEFETLLAQFDEPSVKRAVYRGMAWYLKNHTGSGEHPETVLRSIFETRVAALTNQRKGAGRGGDEPYLGMLESWRKGEGSFRLAKAAYYWLHIDPADGSYAERIDMELLKKPFHERFERTVSGDVPPASIERAAFPTLADLKKDATRNTFGAINRLARNPSIFFPSVVGSGFEFRDLIAAAEEELFVCGQNLFSLVKENNGAETLRLIRAAAERGVSIKLMICDPADTNHIGPWSFACSSLTYGDDLRKAASIFATWPDQVPGGELQIRVAKFIPTSVTFLDPMRRTSRLALITPHHFAPVSAARPFILLTHHADSALYDQYHRNYDHVWDHATDIQLPSPPRTSR